MRTVLCLIVTIAFFITSCQPRKATLNDTEIESLQVSADTNYISKDFIKDSQINWLQIKPDSEIIDYLDPSKPTLVYWRVDWVSGCKSLENTLLHDEINVGVLNNHFNCIAITCFTDEAIIYEGVPYRMDGKFHEFQLKFDSHPVYPSFYIFDSGKQKPKIYKTPEHWNRLNEELKNYK